MTFNQPRAANGRFMSKSGTTPEVGLADWREQTVSVFGTPWPLGKVVSGRLFHGSTRELPVGTVLVPQRAGNRNFAQSAADAVSITSCESRAAFWAAKSGGTPYIYEVEPLSEVEVHRAGVANYGKNIELFEGRVSSARIIAQLPPPTSDIVKPLRGD